MNVLILGGSSDIGECLGKYLLSMGYNVIIGYNKHASNVNNIEFVKCNICNEDEIDRTIKYVIDKYGKIDILICMGAISRDNEFLSKTKEEFMEVLEVNLVGTFLCNKIYSKYINDGMIINISSTDGIDTYSAYSIDYSASKAGIINMTKSISLATNNKVLCICPNWCDSNSTREMDNNYLENELKRIGQSRLITLDELNECIYKIINDENVSGDIFRIDIKDDRVWIEKK